MDSIQNECKRRRMSVPLAFRWRIEKHDDGDRLLIATDSNNMTQYSVIIATPDTLVSTDEVIANVIAQLMLVRSNKK